MSINGRGGTLGRWDDGGAAAEQGYGYQDRRPASAAGEVDVVTPRATVAVLRAGYVPVLRPSA